MAGGVIFKLDVDWLWPVTQLIFGGCRLQVLCMKVKWNGQIWSWPGAL